MPTVDDATLHRLIELQTEDSAIRRLEHQRETLPEAQRLSAIREQLAELNADIEIATKQRDEVAREQDRLEGEIGILDAKTAKEEQRMYSGGVSNPKELNALQSEIQMLKRQRATQEDSLLEVMVQRESAVETLERLTKERDILEVESTELGVKVAELNGEIDGALTEHRGKRELIVPHIAEPVLKLYEQIREQKGGVGVALLQGGTCQGCHTSVPSVEIERIRAEGGLQRCDNCRRIIVIA